MNAVLPKRLEQFVRRQVKAGRYKNQSDVVRHALQRLEQELNGRDYLYPSPFPAGTLEAIYEGETEAERQWENRTAAASSLKAEAF
jgi:putative addiction module CopG family antidote